MKRICKQCGMEFEITDAEISFYSSKKLALPKRCRDCRNENRMKAGYRFTEEDHIKEKNYENALKNLASKNNKNNIKNSASKNTYQGNKNYKNGKENIHEKKRSEVKNQAEQKLNREFEYYKLKDSKGRRKNYKKYNPKGKSDLILFAEVMIFIVVVCLISAWIIGTGGPKIKSSQTDSKNNVPEKSQEAFSKQEEKEYETELVTDQFGNVIGSETVKEEETTTRAHVDCSFENEPERYAQYGKYGVGLGYTNPEDYEIAAQSLVNNQQAVLKVASDGSNVYFLSTTGEVVVLDSSNRTILTYFKKSDNKELYRKLIRETE